MGAATLKTSVRMARSVRPRPRRWPHDRLPDSAYSTQSADSVLAEMLSPMHRPSLLSSDLSSHPPFHTASYLRLDSALYLNLDLNLNPSLLPSLDRASLAKLLVALLPALDPSLLRSLHVSTHRSLLAGIDAALLPEMQPGRRPLPYLLVPDARSELPENALVTPIPGPSENHALVYWPSRTHSPVHPPPVPRPHVLLSQSFAPATNALCSAASLSGCTQGGPRLAVHASIDRFRRHEKVLSYCLSLVVCRSGKKVSRDSHGT